MRYEDVSGDYYDWTRMMMPERPYLHAYHQTWVTKFFLADKRPAPTGTKVFLDFAGAMEVIRRLDALTLGVPKIVYLVGWNYDGHDSKYPAWDVVNPALKRPEDPDALTSLRWLMKESRRFNTTVSLHINMIDAFADSPLWEEYVAKDVIAKGEDGRVLPGEVFGSPIGAFSQSYQISYAREWETGLAQRRIDALVEMLGLSIDQGGVGTVHIDAFHSHAPVRPGDDCISPYNRKHYGHTVGEEIRAQRKILRYWRGKGVDVTSEGNAYWLRRDPFVGLQAMAWHFTPVNGVIPSLQCGTPAQIENEVLRDPEYLAGVREAFCSRVVPWMYWNAPAEKRGDGGGSAGDDFCLPAVWRGDLMVGWSKHGSKRSWSVPSAWGGCRAVQVWDLSVEGPTRAERVEVRDGKFELELSPARGVSVTRLDE